MIRVFILFFLFFIHLLQLIIVLHQGRTIRFLIANLICNYLFLGLFLFYFDFKLRYLSRIADARIVGLICNWIRGQFRPIIIGWARSYFSLSLFRKFGNTFIKVGRMLNFGVRGRLRLLNIRCYYLFGGNFDEIWYFTNALMSHRLLWYFYLNVYLRLQLSWLPLLTYILLFYQAGGHLLDGFSCYFLIVRVCFFEYCVLNWGNFHRNRHINFLVFLVI